HVLFLFFFNPTFITCISTLSLHDALPISLSHNRWLEQETDRIFDFGKNSVVPTGFGWLGNKGQIKEEMGTHLWITARMLHVYSVDRKSTRLNSSHVSISYAVFCLKKKTTH